MTLRTAREFFAAEGIACVQRHPGLLFVEHEELERAAAEAAERQRRQRLRQGLSLYLGVVVSGLAAMAVVPRLKAL